MAAAASTAAFARPAISQTAPSKIPPPQVKQDPALAGKLGVVTAILSRHMSVAPAPGKFTLLELPRVLRDELDLTIIDYNSVNFPNFDPAMLEKLRSNTEDAGCVATNLKMNQKVDMGSADDAVREQALKVYRKTIDAAALLGLRWVRPLPQPTNEHPEILVDSLRHLADYAAESGIAVLVENFGWMMDDPDSVVKLLKAIDRPGQVAAGIDTGNWADNEVRYPALEKSMPLAVTCDFKAKVMADDGSHAAYDLKKCFDIAWAAGFRGPWAFEHGHTDRARCFLEIGLLRDWMREWMKAA
jgi:hypothetical protein